MDIMTFGNIKCEALTLEDSELPSSNYGLESVPSRCYFRSDEPAVLSDCRLSLPGNCLLSNEKIEHCDFISEQPCFPQKNEIRDIFKFFSRKQQENEPFDKFFAELKSLAKKCAFGEQEERILKAQIVLGVESKSLQQRISREDISLERIVLHCVSVDVADRKHRQIEKQETVGVNLYQNGVKSVMDYSPTREVDETNRYDLELPTAKIEPEDKSASLEPETGQSGFPFPGNFLLVDVKTEDFGVESKLDSHPPADFPSQDEYVRAFQPLNNEKTLLPEVDDGSLTQATELVQQYMANMSVVNKAHACRDCGKLFSRKENLTRHYRITHTREKPFVCSQCGKQFSLKAHMERHRLTHMRIKLFRCPICMKSFSQKSHLERHQVTHLELKMFTCLDCHKTFSRKENLQRHRQVHLETKRFNCSECGRRFTRKEQMVLHQLTHSDEKPFECTECGKRFARKDCFVTHQHIHTEPRRFSCNECGKSFSRKDNLIAHHRTHSDYKPFSCPDCGKLFSRETNLTRHRLTHSEIRLYHCSQCGKSFSRKEHLRGHQLTHSDVKPYDCSQCNKSFARKEHLVKHQKSIHAVNVMNLVNIVLKNDGL